MLHLAFVTHAEKESVWRKGWGEKENETRAGKVTKRKGNEDTRPHDARA